MTILNLSGRIAISRPFSGDPSQVRAARRFVAGRLGDGHPCRDDAVQLIGELVAESLRHAASCGRPPGYGVSVLATPDAARVTLSTQGCGCWTSPELTPGRGVHLVDLFTRRWGVSASRAGVCVWFELGQDDADPPSGDMGAGDMGTGDIEAGDMETGGMGSGGTRTA